MNVDEAMKVFGGGMWANVDAIAAAGEALVAEVKRLGEVNAHAVADELFKLDVARREEPALRKLARVEALVPQWRENARLTMLGQLVESVWGVAADRLEDALKGHDDDR